jgi:hypothetical protein
MTSLQNRLAMQTARPSKALREPQMPKDIWNLLPKKVQQKQAGRSFGKDRRILR